ncbi:LysR family transcriptional regulator [Alginatibacterium sediminis]|uniref:LysR family transcriptional regulator n=1 Tax=Alginatibacterium sediminis TaxID=2164068 RepID=A0A420E5N4_9ALTE|nr:LysR family transcriptional regulator [Alginatibacterium sediminis]RKF12770.1 LysR family transcriptional regulator [Alginatibacterium sediminis]
MNHEHLRAFIAVVQFGSFRSAALHLHKTQPSISASVRKLEMHYDLQLFDREPYRPQLTSAGEQLYQQAQQLMLHAQELDLFAQQLSKGADPVLRLTLSPMCELEPLFTAIKAFKTQQTSLQLNIETGHLSGILEPLQLGSSDLSIGPSIGADGHFELKQITSMRMLTVAAPELFESMVDGQSLSHAQIRRHPHILLADSGSQAPFDNINVINGAQRWFVSDYYAKKQLLLSGMGWARIPLHLVREELDRGQLIAIKVQDFNWQSEVPIYMLRHRDVALRETVSLFWTFIAEHFDKD